MNKEGLAGSFWPSAQQELILQTALLDDERARLAWQKLTRVLDLDHLEEGSYALMPQLYRRLLALEIDAAELPRLKGIHRRTWYANQLYLERTGVLLRACAERRVEPIVAGDAAVLARVYDDTGTREIQHLDVLIRGDDRAGALEAAGQAGWTGGCERALRTLERRGSARLTDGARRALIVQTALLPEFAMSAKASETFGAGVTGQVAGLPARLLDPADELVRVCALGARRTFYRSVVWAADAARLVASNGDTLHWDRVIAAAMANGAALPVTDALRYLAKTLDVAVPPEVVEKIAAVPADKRDALAHRLAGGSAGSAGAAIAPLVRTGDGRLSSTLRSIPGFLRDRLSLDRARDVPGEVVRRKLAQVSSRRKR